MVDLSLAVPSINAFGSKFLKRKTFSLKGGGVKRRRRGSSDWPASSVTTHVCSYSYNSILAPRRSDALLCHYLCRAQRKRLFETWIWPLLCTHGILKRRFSPVTNVCLLIFVLCSSACVFLSPRMSGFPHSNFQSLLLTFFSGRLL